MSATTPETHTARKRHRCDLCSTHIAPGSRYLRWRYYDDTDASTVRVHPSCEAARVELDIDEWHGPPLLEFNRCDLDPLLVGSDLRAEWEAVLAVLFDHVKPDNAKRATGGKPNRSRRAYPMPDPLIWTERANGFRAEFRGQLVYVRQMKLGWLWTWSHLGGNGGFATAALAIDNAERELVNLTPKTLEPR